MRYKMQLNTWKCFNTGTATTTIFQKGKPMHLIWTILIGFVAGLIAKAITPGSGPSGFFMTSVLGIGGSLAASYLGQFLGWYQPGQSAGFIGAIIGAIILLGIYHLVTKK
jgi:uncharacterized membrane protein YeaQ/YmgE (transglycosylase-associated protein family)